MIQTQRIVPDDDIPPLQTLERAEDDLLERGEIGARLATARDALAARRAERRRLADELTVAEQALEGRTSWLGAVLGRLRRRSQPDRARLEDQVAAARSAVADVDAEVARCRTELDRLDDRSRLLDTAETDYERALQELAEQGDDPVVCDPSVAAEARRVLGVRRELSDLDVAIGTGRGTLQALETAQGTLSAACGWSTWDIVSGGSGVSRLKFERIDEVKCNLDLVAESVARFVQQADALGGPDLDLPDLTVPSIDRVERFLDVWLDVGGGALDHELRTCRMELGTVVARVGHSVAVLEGRRSQVQACNSTYVVSGTSR
ncbi:MAG: hypothetical protein L0H79_08365 [Intrasporangium sp.]|uniref:hypothetical protein n=1 Tax=Intrasporangium sp. TaxID=1925024 RepID=UPI002648DB8B|nr:hypothetical protein [Intrasporangium sp.]MDN5795751.1 hypothetical protein [Intrasporangium sp.]